MNASGAEIVREGKISYFYTHKKYFNVKIFVKVKCFWLGFDTYKMFSEMLNGKRMIQSHQHTKSSCNYLNKCRKTIWQSSIVHDVKTINGREVCWPVIGCPQNIIHSKCYIWWQNIKSYLSESGDETKLFHIATSVKCVEILTALINKQKEIIEDWERKKKAVVVCRWHDYICRKPERTYR